MLDLETLRAQFEQEQLAKSNAFSLSDDVKMQAQKPVIEESDIPDEEPAQPDQQPTDLATLRKQFEAQYQKPANNKGIAGNQRKQAVYSIVQEKAPKYGLDPDYMMALIEQESNFNPDIVSPKGAAGLMQLMPGTAKEMGVQDRFDPEQSIEGGFKYFRQQLDRFGGDVTAATAAYNAGPGAVQRYGGVPPFAETQTYLKKINEKYAKNKGTYQEPQEPQEISLKPADNLEALREEWEISQGLREKREEPGMIGSLIRGGVAGFPGAVDTLLNAAGALGLDTDEYIDKLEKWTKENKRTAPPKEGFNRDLYDAAESVSRSIVSRVPGMAVGAAAGGPVGAAVGAVASGGALYGLAEYNGFLRDVKKYAKQAGADPEEAVAAARDKAILSGIAEWGFETVGDLAIGKVLGVFGKGATSSIREGLKESWKKAATNYAKKAGKISATEAITEFPTGYVQTDLRQDVGIPTEQTPMEAGMQSAKIAALSGPLFGLVPGAGGQAGKRVGQGKDEEIVDLTDEQPEAVMPGQEVQPEAPAGWRGPVIPGQQIEPPREIVPEQQPPQRIAPQRTSSRHIVQTEDLGEFPVLFMRHQDGSVTIMPQGNFDGNAIEYNSDFARDKSEADLLAYTYEPKGFIKSVPEQQEEQSIQPQQQAIEEYDNLPRPEGRPFRGPSLDTLTRQPLPEPEQPVAQADFKTYQQQILKAQDQDSIVGTLQQAEQDPGIMPPEKKVLNFYAKVRAKELQAGKQPVQEVPQEVVAPEVPQQVQPEIPAQQQPQEKPENIFKTHARRIAQAQNEQEATQAYLEAEQAPLSPRSVKMLRNLWTKRMDAFKQQGATGTPFRGPSLGTLTRQPLPQEMQQETPQAQPAMPEVPVVQPTQEVAPGPVEIEQKGDTAEITVDITKGEISSLTPKEQKLYLLKEIDTAIANLGNKEQGKGTKAWISKENNVSVPNTIKFKVPGDGVFRIANSKKALVDFKKSVFSKFPTSKNAPSPKGYHYTQAKKTGKRLSGEGITYYNSYEQRDLPARKLAESFDYSGKNARYTGITSDGFLTDGHMLVKVDPKQFNGLSKVEQTIDDLPIRKAGHESHVLAEFHSGQAKEKPLIHIVSNDGKYEAVFNADYVDAILTEHPGASAYLHQVDHSVDKDGMQNGDFAVVFGKDGIIVGAVMPINYDTVIGSLDSVARELEGAPVKRPQREVSQSEKQQLEQPAPPSSTLAGDINAAIESKPSGMLQQYEKQLADTDGAPIKVQQGRQIELENALYNETVSPTGKLGGTVTQTGAGKIGRSVFEVERPYGKIIYDEASGELRVERPDLTSAMTTEKDVKFGVDKTLLLQTISKDIVNNDLAGTIANETIQNALDSFPKGQKDRNVTVKLWEDWGVDMGEGMDSVDTTTVVISDNGSGMTEKEVVKNLLRLGAKGKEGTTTRGGYGLAKAGFLLTPIRARVTTVKDGIITTLEGTREQFFGVKGAGSPKLTTGPAYGASNGTEFELTFFRSDIQAKEHNAFGLPQWEAARAFKKYIDEGVFMEGVNLTYVDGAYGTPQVTHSKPISELEQVYAPKTLSIEGNKLTVYFPKDDKPPDRAWDGKFYPNNRIFNKGLALFSLDGRLRFNALRERPDWKVLIDFEKTPDVRSLDYPFIRNRTELNDKIREKVHEIVNAKIKEINEEAFQGEKTAFAKMIEDSPTVNGIRVLIPFKDQAEFDKAKQLIEENDDLVSDLAEAFTSFKYLLKKIGEQDIELTMTVDPKVHGFRSVPEVTGHEFYAINPFAITGDFTNSPFYKELVGAEYDNDTAMASNLVHTLVHEYAHKRARGHDEGFTMEMSRLYNKMTHTQLARLEAESKEFYGKHGENLGKLQEHFSGMGKGGSQFRQSNSAVSATRTERGRTEGRQDIQGTGEERVARETRYSLTDSKPAGTEAQELRTGLASKISSLKYPVKIVQSVSELPGNHPKNVSGLVYNGTAYLVADNLTDVADAGFVLDHEIPGHIGTRAVLGNKYEPFFSGLALAHGKDIAPYQKKYAARAATLKLTPKETRMLAAEEWFADQIAAGNYKSGKMKQWWDRFVRLFREGLRNLGFDVKLSDTELADIAGRARKAVLDKAMRNGVNPFALTAQGGYSLVGNRAKPEDAIVQFGNAGTMASMEKEADKQKEGGVIFETGKPVTFQYLKNKEKSPYMGERFGQHIEPKGNYVIHNYTHDTYLVDKFPDKYKIGEITFNNPLVIQIKEALDHKQILFDKYKKKGAALSKAIVKDGYDGIVSMYPDGHTGEIIDLSSFVDQSTPLSLASKITDTPEFKRWFRRSRVVDEDENPLVVYHWTDSDFKEFDESMLGALTESNTNDANAIKMAKAGFWFTDKDISDKTFSDRAMPVYLSMRNPKIWKGDFWNLGKNINKIKNAGHDGVIVKDAEFGGTSYVVFSPTQIKSIFNTTFDETNPDIRYSLATPIKDELRATLNAIVAAAHPQDATFMGDVVLSPEYWKDPKSRKVVDAAIAREQRRHQLFFDHMKPLELLANLKFTNRMSKLRNFDRYGFDDENLPKAYRDAKNYLLHMDINETPWDSIKEKVKGKVSKETWAAIDETRAQLDELIDLMRKPVQDVIADLEAKKTASNPDPEIEIPTADGKGVKHKLSDLVALYRDMGTLKGFYFPRIREAGDIFLTAKDKDGKFYRFHKPSRRQAEKLRLQLERKGFTDIDIGNVNKLPDVVYQDLNMIDMGKAIEYAINNSNSDDSSVKAALRADVLQSAANMMKARAFRSHKIARTGRNAENVVKGYIEDPLEAVTIYLSQLSGGIAKGEAAQEMLKGLMAVNPAQEPMRYKRLRNYIQEQLRNPDKWDRAIALGKSIVSFKFLGLNPRSALVNTTAQVTTVPPAILKYALGNKGSLLQIGGALIKSGKDYGAFMRGNALQNEDEQAFMEQIKRDGYDNPQLTHDAMRNIQGAMGSTWSKIMEHSMYLFGKTEQWNRGSTLLAAYRLARKQGQTDEQARKSAIEATNKAHGIYGKATLPTWAQGDNPFAKLAQLGYTYSKFGHNYVQMLLDHGISKDTIKGLTYAIVAPSVLGGATSLVGYNILLGVAKGIMQAFGDDREPEKLVYDYIRKEFGDDWEKTARYGLAGAIGVDLSGSLGVGMEIPKSMTDLIGPFGGVYKDLERSWHHIQQGNVERATEEVLPNFFKSIARAYREINGATTTYGNPIWDEDGKPYVPDSTETALRAAGFRSSKRATLQERAWESTQEQQNYKKRKDSIYEKYRNYLQSGSKDKAKLKEIFDEVAEFNKTLKEQGKTKLVPPITREALKRQARSILKPNKRVKARLE